MSIRSLLHRLMYAGAGFLLLSSAFAAGPTRMFTGPGTQSMLGGQLSRSMAAVSGPAIEVVTTAGPADVLQMLRNERNRPGLRLALLQADTGPAYLSAAERGNAEAAAWLEPLRVIASLHAEQVYFIVRKESGLEALHDIRNARINVGPLNGGTALAVSSLYRLMFDKAIPDDQASFLSHERALAKMLTDGDIDVVAVLTDTPAKLLINMKPGAERFIRLLRFDPAWPRSQAVLAAFEHATIRAADYPNLLHEDLPALGSRIYLVTDVSPSADDKSLVRFERAWCHALSRLHARGHAHWREANESPGRLLSGWRRIDVEACRQSQQ